VSVQLERLAHVDIEACLARLQHRGVVDRGLAVRAPEQDCKRDGPERRIVRVCGRPVLEEAVLTHGDALWRLGRH
jgi:hypothetical protein